MVKKKNCRNKLVIDSLTITHNKLQYQHDGYSCGYGKHKNKKAYNRKPKYPVDYND